jgi:hypothetical protein
VGGDAEISARPIRNPAPPHDQGAVDYLQIVDRDPSANLEFEQSRAAARDQKLNPASLQGRSRAVTSELSMLLRVRRRMNDALLD